MIQMPQVLRALDGTPLSAPSGEMTLRWVLVETILTNAPSQQTVGNAEKLRRMNLAREFTIEDTVVLSPEDVVLLKELLALLWAPIICGQATEMIDPGVQKNAPEKWKQPVRDLSEHPDGDGSRPSSAPGRGNSHEEGREVKAREASQEEDVRRAS